ncbi:phage major tail protein, TP901-1 family [Weissella paramesenteroides]|uniref:phage major tail protein, TP901-1 family n=1 Tax=Weissella paramesenteroides TaxID=1249 RepID=UPI0039829130
MVKTLQGVKSVLFARKHADAETKEMQLVPYQTSLTFDPSRDGDSTVTKDGAVNTSSSVETDLEVEFINNTAAVSDELLQAIFDDELMDMEIVRMDRSNASGEYEAWYMQGHVSEDSNDNDADDHSTRDVSFSVDGTPKHGWTSLTTAQQDDVDYVFRGLNAVTTEDATGGGTAWNDTDNGVAADAAV